MKRILLVISCCVLLSPVLFSQWQPVNGPYGGTVSNLILKNQKLFALTYQKGVFSSVDNGNSWVQSNNGITYPQALCSTVKGNRIYVGTSQGLFSSSDNGITWNTVLINGFANYLVQSMGSNLQSIFIITGYNHDKLFRSDNDGLTWTELTISGGYLYALGVQGNNVFVGGDYFYRSIDNGNNFGILSPNLGMPTSFTFDGTVIFLTSIDGNIYKSTDNGDSWNLILNGASYQPVISLAVDGSKLYAGCFCGENYQNPPAQGGIYVTQDAGAHWANLGMQGFSIKSLIISGTRIIAGTATDGIFISDDNGISWNASNHNLVNLPVIAVAEIGSDLFISTNLPYPYTNGYFNRNLISHDDGNTWKIADSGMTYPVINCYANGGNFILAGGYEVYQSFNQGSTWQTVFSPGFNIGTLVVSGTKIFAGTLGGGVFLSEDQCATWRSVNIGLGNFSIQSMIMKGNILFVGTTTGIYRSANYGSTWSQAGAEMEGQSIVALAANNNFLFASGSSSIPGIFRSSDNGNTWLRTNTDFPYWNYPGSLAILGNTIVAGTTDMVNEILYSNDNGDNWSVVNTGLPGGLSVPSLVIHDSTVYAAGLINTYPFLQEGGLWKRHLSDFVPFLIDRDTLFMMETSGDLKTLDITSETPWLVDATLPSWLTSDKNSGTGSDVLSFITTQANPGQQPRYTSVDVVSEGMPRHCVIVQKQKINGIEDLINARLTIYPSPAHDFIMISVAGNSGRSLVKIINAQGEEMRELQLTATNNRIDISSLPAGIYFVKLINDSKMVSGKFVKE